jgi:hypothetical protein
MSLQNYKLYRLIPLHLFFMFLISQNHIERLLFNRSIKWMVLGVILAILACATQLQTPTIALETTVPTRENSPKVGDLPGLLLQVGERGARLGSHKSPVHLSSVHLPNT